MHTIRILGIAILAAGITGCSAFRQSVREERPEDVSILTAKFDHHDLKDMAADATRSVLEHPFPPEGSKAPIVVNMGVQNRTKTHLDTQALADTITTMMLDTGRMQFVDAARRDALLKEQGFQLANCTDETKVAMGRQLGARYMLSGSFIELGASSGRQVRVSKKEDVYYQLTITVTDIETGLIVLRKQVERLRRASKPLIGW